MCAARGSLILCHRFEVIPLYFEIGDPAVSLRGLDVAMPEQILDRAQIGIGLVCLPGLDHFSKVPLINWCRGLRPLRRTPPALGRAFMNGSACFLYA
jgi:hypothetical protein